MLDSLVEVSAKWAKHGEDEIKFNVNEVKANKKRTTPVIQSAFLGDSGELLVCKSGIFAQFKKIFYNSDASRIHSY